MAKEGTINWNGDNGKQYKYEIYPIRTTFTEGPANYVFARKASDGFHNVYAGETGDLSERFDDHERMPCIKREGATHVTMHPSSAVKSQRLEEETAIRRYYNPPCNRQ